MAAPSLISDIRINKTSAAIVSSAMKVHSILGPGLLESAYDACLAHELRKRGFRVDTQVGLPVIYEGEKLDLGYRIDLLVENLVIVEVKCVEAIHPVHGAQLLSYLRLSGKNVGLLINFYAYEGRHQAHGRRLELGQAEPLNHGVHRVARRKTSPRLAVAKGPEITTRN